jgi:hypothetical protein
MDVGWVELAASDSVRLCELRANKEGLGPLTPTPKSTNTRRENGKEVSKNVKQTGKDDCSMEGECVHLVKPVKSLTITVSVVHLPRL